MAVIEMKQESKSERQGSQISMPLQKTVNEMKRRKKSVMQRLSSMKVSLCRQP